MDIKLINIGNSKGIRLPKAILQQVGWEEYGELQVQEGAIILRPKKQPRQGWEQAFGKTAPASHEEKMWLEAGHEDTLWDEEEAW